jgi:hypothetical protein
VTGVVVTGAPALLRDRILGVVALDGRTGRCAWAGAGVVGAVAARTSTATTPQKSAVAVHASVTDEPVAGAVAPAEFPAPEFSSPTAIYRLVAGDVAEAKTLPQAANAAMILPLVLLATAALGVPLLPNAVTGVPTPAVWSALLNEIEPPGRHAPEVDDTTTVCAPDGGPMSLKTWMNPAFELLAWTFPTDVIATPLYVADSVAPSVPQPTPTSRTRFDPVHVCDHDSDVALSVLAPATWPELDGPTASKADPMAYPRPGPEASRASMAHLRAR